MTHAVFQRGICTCGRLVMIFSKDKEDIARKLREDIGDKWEIFIADGTEEVFCSSCGQGINLPIPEMLDTDRYPLGRFLQEMDKELEEGQNDKTNS